jgi:hypothetical protein
MQSSRTRNDSTLLIVLSLAALARNCLYVEEMHSLYENIWIGLFGNFIRGLQNKNAFHDRGLIRNIIFDIFRSCLRPVAYPLLFENGNIDKDSLILNVASCAFFAIFIHLFISKKFLERHSLIFGYAQAELILMYPEGTLYAFNHIEKIHDGRLVIVAIVFYLECHFSLHGWLIEDILFRDLGVIGGPIKNWGFYIY